MDKRKPKLEEIPKTNAFDAPDGFFDSFYDELEHAIDAKEHKNDKVRSLNTSFYKNWIPVAASVSLLLLVGTYFWANQNPEISEVDVLSTVSSEEIAFYLENSSLDTESLLEQVDLSLIALEQNNLEELENVSEEDLNLIIEQYEDLF